MTGPDGRTLRPQQRDDGGRGAGQPVSKQVARLGVDAPRGAGAPDRHGHLSTGGTDDDQLQHTAIHCRHRPKPCLGHRGQQRRAVTEPAHVQDGALHPVPSAQHERERERYGERPGQQQPRRQQQGGRADQGESDHGGHGERAQTPVGAPTRHRRRVRDAARLAGTITLRRPKVSRPSVAHALSVSRIADAPAIPTWRSDERTLNLGTARRVVQPRLLVSPGTGQSSPGHRSCA